MVFPSSILADTAESSNIWVSEPMSIKGGKDTQIEVKGVDLPGAAGGYGPFGLRTRAYKGGQIVDWNATFGNLYVSKPLGDPLPLTITPYSQ